MPKFDGTGPWGYGRLTGWGMGPCGAGMGWKRGFGRFNYRITEEEEKEILKREAESLEDELKAVKERLSGLKGSK